MLQDLLERGLRIDESILCVVDGGKGIRKALVDVLGDLAVIQRCHFHKLRNLRSYLPKSRHAYVLQTMKEAYKCKSADKARKQLRALVSWLERNGYDEAAGSLREGMEETLTVLKLALPELLRRSLANPMRLIPVASSLLLRRCRSVLIVVFDPTPPSPRAPTHIEASSELPTGRSPRDSSPQIPVVPRTA